MYFSSFFAEKKTNHVHCSEFVGGMTPCPNSRSMHTDKHTYTQTHPHTHTHTYSPHTRTHTYTHIHTHSHTHLYKYRHAHTYTHTHTHISHFSYACKIEGKNGISCLISALCINCLISILEYSRTIDYSIIWMCIWCGLLQKLYKIKKSELLNSKVSSKL